MRKVFLHFGPGGHPEVDRYYLNDDSIEYLQQSLYTGFGEYIPQLIQETSSRLVKITDTADTIEVIAHSFGAFLLNQQPQALIDKISKVHMVAPTFNIFHSLANLFSYGVSQKAVALKSSLERLKEIRSPELLWSFWGEFINIYPDYFGLYFQSDESFKNYHEVAAKFPPLNQESLVKAINELTIDYNSWPPQFKNYREVALYLGKSDPLISLEDQELLINYFGPENTTIIDAGHFPHLEQKITF